MGFKRACGGLALRRWLMKMKAALTIHVAVDTNAHRRDSPHHEAAASSVRRLAEGNSPWGIPWPCVFHPESTGSQRYRLRVVSGRPQRLYEVDLEDPTCRGTVSIGPVRVDACVATDELSFVHGEPVRVTRARKEFDFFEHAAGR